MKPSTYDMTFCISKCKDKCYRHISHYEFEEDRNISHADFKCKEKRNNVI